MRLIKFNIKAKLIAFYVTFCTILIFVTSIIITKYAVSNLEESTLSFMELSSSQISHNLDTTISNLDNLSKSIYYDSFIFLFLLDSEEYTPIEATKKKLTINQILNRLLAQNTNIFGVNIISAKGEIYNMGYGQELVLPSITSQHWYDEIIKANGELVITPTHYVPYTSYEDRLKVITVGRVFKDIYSSKKGVLLFDIKPEVLANTVITDFTNHNYDRRVVITTSADEVIFDSEVEAESFTDLIYNPRYMTKIKHSDTTGLKVYTIINKDQLYRPIEQMQSLVIIIIIISIIVIVIFSFMWSQKISAPIISLSKSMKKVTNGIYETIPDTNQNDEIGILVNTYNIMLVKIKTLIEDVYLAKLNRKEAELSALQMQINPHMLYNTLESIRMKSIINNDLEVSNMIKILGKMFRISLDRSSGPNYIQDEITYVRTYIQLQNIRYENRFILDIDISQAVMCKKIIPMVFQPIIENAINHGFKDKKVNCVIFISGESHDRGVTITISDNGSGMNEKLVEEVIAKLNQNQITSTSIGLSNIANRLRLNYGDKHEFLIVSKEGVGTTIRLIIPHI